MSDYSAHVAEVRKYVQMLKDRFLNTPENAWIGIKREDGSDYGAYYEAVVYYIDDDEEASNFALFVESNCPWTWNDTKQIDWKKGAPAPLRNKSIWQMATARHCRNCAGRTCCGRGWR